MLPLRQRAITYTSQAPSASSSRLPIAPFFLPYTTHRPVPLGNQTIMPAGISSLWSALESPPTVETTIPSSVSSSHSVQITAFDLAHINEEISYLDESDEHADIAAGDRIIDDSLGDDSPGGTEDTTDTAEAEIPDDENCTKYHGHYALWIWDEIVELAIAVGSKTSFPLPRVLSTRIATSETIGILPISKSLAETLKITTLPRLQITGLPHHRDTPVHVLTRLCTKSTNRYRYLQLRQRTLCAVVPVHTQMLN
ncbi:hypothetical protein B0H13DRAFT_2657659 [Mycena leptocephala]|nr:hypothetical protein B0H13DRAFT_2657659 [Mycena leptocephala]